MASIFARFRSAGERQRVRSSSTHIRWYRGRDWGHASRPCRRLPPRNVKGPFGFTRLACRHDGERHCGGRRYRRLVDLPQPREPGLCRRGFGSRSDGGAVDRPLSPVSGRSSGRRMTVSRRSRRIRSQGPDARSPYWCPVPALRSGDLRRWPRYCWVTSSRSHHR